MTVPYVFCRWPVFHRIVRESKEVKGYVSVEVETRTRLP